MILLAHPSGNANVRAVLAALEEAELLAKFVTTLGWSKRAVTSSPPLLRRHLQRRAYDLPPERIESYPWREAVRLVAGQARVQSLIVHERGWASLDRVWQGLDMLAARHLLLSRRAENISAVYGYEDCALNLLETARNLGVRRAYDLPIAYWETAQQLLREEAERYPDWEPTLGGTRDSPEKLARKTAELELAQMVICPSNFVLESLPEYAKATKACVMIPFGSPPAESSVPTLKRAAGRRLRVLFAGALTQRKGLADLFEAIKLVGAADVELVLMGSPLRPLRWYRERYPGFVYEPTRPHADVLALMRTCDVLVLPSIVEGRALVQQEAMASGLPLIATRNAGGDDLITEGETGFLVPIRSPEALAEKISWCAAHREELSGMGIAAQRRAAALTWDSYGEQILAAIRNLIG